MKIYVENIKKYMIAFLQVQCLLSLVSLPVLVAWGLPISLMTAVGNCIFNPFITAFLFCASLIFFTEILRIPNHYLIVLLDWITNAWLYCLSFGMQSWLVGFPLIMFPLLCCIALIAFLALQHIQLGKPLTYICLCSCLLLGTAVIKTYLPKPGHIEIICKRKKVTVVNENGNLHLIDHGGLGESNSVTSWVNYTLLPEILQQFGTQSITTLTSPYTCPTTHTAIEILCRECDIQKLHCKQKSI